LKYICLTRSDPEKGAECGEVHEVFLYAGAFGSLEYFGNGQESPVAEQKTESVEPDASLADMEVTIHAAAQILFAVIDVKSLYLPDADQSVEFAHRPCVCFLGADIVSCRKQVARIETHTGAIRIPRFFQERRKVFKSMAKTAPLSGSILQQELDGWASQLQRMPQGPGNSRYPCRDPGPHMRSGMKDQVRHSKEIGAAHLFNQGIDGLPVQVPVRGRQVNQIAVVRHNDLNSRIFPRILKQNPVRLRQQLCFPLIAAFKKNLNGTALKAHTSFQSPVHTPGDRHMGSGQ
jgi:hypothetical protein